MNDVIEDESLVLSDIVKKVSVFFFFSKIYSSDGRGEEEMMGQLHALKTCIRLSVCQVEACVSGLIYQL